MDGEISPERLETLLQSDDNPAVVDIRNPAEFDRVRIPDSINIPLSRLPRQVDRLDGEDHVVTVCPHGKASVRAARLIESFEGFDGTVESLESGLEGWTGPMTAGSGRSDEQDTESPGGSNAPF